MTVVAPPSFFQSLSASDVERMLGPLARRQFPTGALVLAQGDRPIEMYVITSGVCGLFVRDRDGLDAQIGQIGPGATIGETALFAGQAEAINAAPATLRALTELDVVTLDPPGFYALATAFPQLLHNIGAILSHRLTRSYQHAARPAHGRVTVLLDRGGPPPVAYALACSIAWHSRASTILVVVGDSGSSDLEVLATRRRDSGVGARLVLVPPTEGFAPTALPGTVEELLHDHRHVVLLLTGRDEGERPSIPGLTGRTLRLAGGTSSLAPDSASRPGHTLRAWTAGVRPPRPNAGGILDVPPLEPADHLALREGLLPTATAAGRALGWMARDLCGLKVGLALGAGSVRGYAHYGVLRVFERIGLQADYVAGTSIGAIVAASYALGQSADEAARIMEETSIRAFRLTIPFHSLLSNAGVSGNFQQVGGNVRIEDLNVPLALVAADLRTGREIVIRRGLLRVAALASMAIPGIYPPVRMGGYVLVDGGVVNPVPISVAASMGADVVIAVSLGRPASEPELNMEAVEDRGRLPSLVHTIARSVEIMQGRIGTQSAAAATVLIQSDFGAIPNVGLQSFHKGRPYIALGEAAGEAALPDIAANLPWLCAPE